MKLSKVSYRLYSLLIGGFFIFAISSIRAEVVVIGQQDFETGTIPTTNGWSFGAQSGGQVSISSTANSNLNGSKGSLRGVYPTPGSGNVYIWGSFDFASLNLNDVYIDFWAKMPNAKYGLKFLKVFGQRVDTKYANTTIGLDYTGVDYGGMYCVSFGDGTTPSNDMQNVINFSGEYPDWIGRSFGKSALSLSSPQRKLWASSNWGDTWHHFRIRIKFNSGTTLANEVADGAYYVEIDNKVYVDAKGVFNRHYSNLPIQKIAFFDWTQGGGYPFEIWYDDIKITTGGFMDKRPAPPIQPLMILN
ncbi:MAG: hypothetical protein V4732_02445 [Pseudomonadota bacterium]